MGGKPTGYPDASGLCPWCLIGVLLELGLIANEIATSDVPMIGGNLGGATARTIGRSAAKETAQNCAVSAKGEYIDGYRAVSKAEADDIAKYGFGPDPTGRSMADKWFSETQQGAEKFRKMFPSFKK